MLVATAVVTMFSIIGCGGTTSQPAPKQETKASAPAPAPAQKPATSSSKYGPKVPSNIPAPHNITRRAVNFLKKNFNVKEVIQQDDAKYVGSNDVGHHFISMVKIRVPMGVKVARVNVHFSPNGDSYSCEAKLRDPRPDGT